MLIYISYAISEFLYVYSIAIFLSSYLGKSRLGKASAIFYGLFYIVDCLIYFTCDKPIVFSISSTIMFFLLSLLYSGPKLKNIGITFIITICIACSECLISGITSVLNQFMDDLNYTYVIVAALFSSRLMFFILAVIFNRKYQKKYYIKQPVPNMGIYITPILSILLLHMMVLISNTYSRPLTTTGNILLIAPATLLISVNILVFYLADRQHNILQLQGHNDILKNAITIQQQQYKSEVQLRTRFHKEKHDYKNFLIGIKSELENGNTANALNKINEHIGILSDSPVSNSGCYALDSIVNYKSELASSFGIKIKTAYRIENELNMSADDLCILFGIALDNAIEYLAEHKDVPQIINVVVNYSRNILIVDISNHVCNDIKITDNSIASTKSSQEHGFGLESARFIIKKYNGNLHLNCRDKIFHFGVSICIEA